MRLSKYTLFIEDYPNPGEHLVYNTRTQALVKINQELKNLLEHIETFSFVPPGQEESLTAFYKMGIVVRDEADDAERFARFIEQKKYGIDRSLFHATILTTYNCNFACTYCFEESTRTSNQKLDRKTADDIMAWLKRKLLRHRMKELMVNYYGGEPLLNRSMIEYISAHMKGWCESNGLGFKFALQTNGALLTKELVEQYKPLGLYRAKVSLDGTREVHDRQRPMRGTGRGTFDVVIQNIVDTVDRIRISLAAGYDKGNPQVILDLVDYLEQIGVLRKLINFTFSPIHPSLGPKGHTEEVVSPGCMSNYDADTLFPAEKRIKETLRRKGFPVSSGLSISMCPLTSGDGGVTIDTQGMIFKCNAMLGHPELSVGSVYEDEYNEKQAWFLSGDDWKKCGSDCPYAPICNTGCRLFAFFKKKDFTAKSCERDYMERAIPEAIKMEYQKQLERKKSQRAPAAAPA